MVAKNGTSIPMMQNKWTCFWKRLDWKVQQRLYLSQYLLAAMLHYNWPSRAGVAFISIILISIPVFFPFLAFSVRRRSTVLIFCFLPPVFTAFSWEWWLQSFFPMMYRNLYWYSLCSVKSVSLAHDFSRLSRRVNKSSSDPESSYALNFNVAFEIY